MSKTLLTALLAAGVGFASLMGCSTSDEASPEAVTPPDPAIGPFPPPPGANAEAGPPPVFNFEDGGTGPVTDAAPDVAPVENDPGATQGARVWAVDGDGRLVAFRVAAPATVSVKLVTGLAAGEKLLDVDFRPADGKMYGLGSSSRIYTIDLVTGVATVVGDGAAFTPALSGQALGFDFNPVADKIRVHTDVDQNLRIDPTTGKVVGVDGMLAFAATDTNVGQSPNLVGTGYTNSVSPAPATTMLYAIDSTRNLLTRLPAPNDGMVETVGPLGVDIDQSAGFDVAKTGTAYAALRIGMVTSLYTIDLATGTATDVGAIAYPVALASIAVEP